MYGKAKPTFEEEWKKLSFTNLTEAISNHDSVKIDGYYEIGKYEFQLLHPPISALNVFPFVSKPTFNSMLLPALKIKSLFDGVIVDEAILFSAFFKIGLPGSSSKPFTIICSSHG